MQVQVRHGLAGTLLAIDNDAVAVADAELLGQLGRDEMQMAEQLTILCLISAWVGMTLRGMMST